ncbi:free fatty acid receptor 3-like [Polypterus senegalus]
MSAPPYKTNPLYLTVYTITLMTGWPTNLLALYAFYKKLRRKATPSVIFMINLTLSDISFLTFLPIKAIEASGDMIWILPRSLCPLSGLFYFSTIYSSTLFLTAVSVDRYLGVAYPLWYKMYRKSSYALVACFCLWVCAFAHCSVVYVTELNRNWSTLSNEFICYDNFSEKQLTFLLPVRLELGLMLFCIPSLITSFCYCSFTRIILSSPHICKEKKQRCVGLVLATLAVFLICFTPYNVSHFVGYAQGSSPTWRGDALLLSTFNACLDPIIFYFSSTAVQKSCRSCLRGLQIKECTNKPIFFLSNKMRSDEKNPNVEDRC